VALLGLVPMAACSSPPNFRFVAISGPMPALGGPTIAGGSLDPGDYAGKVVLINFWASWCAPCRREQPGLQALWRRLQSSGGVAFIGVDHLDKAESASGWIARYDVTYPSVTDPEGAIADRFGVPFLPATIIVDAGGQLRYRLIGAQDARFLEGLLEAVAGLGSAGSPAPSP
jgi:cytochrome c biogenesis protein CcmG/thiol:disulfide interchange protein DsbE